MPGARYQLDHVVSHGDVDLVGEFKGRAVLGLLERAAVEASAALGFDADWYTRNQCLWVVRRTWMTRHRAIGGRDRLLLDTWIEDFRRARSLRRYTIHREGDSAPAITACTDWVYCDAASGRPRRVPEDMERAFSGDAGSLAPLDRAPKVAAPGDEQCHFATRRVRTSDLDHVVHVNNGIWASYLEDAAEEWLASQGWPLGAMLEAGGAFRPKTLDIEYVAEGFPGDELQIHSAAETLPPPGRREPFTLLQSVRKADGSLALRARSDWSWLRRPDVLGAAPRR